MTNEILTEAQLDAVAGGTVAELNELYAALLKNPYFENEYPSYDEISGCYASMKRIVIMELGKKGIEANIDTGYLNTGLHEENNTYTYYGKPLTHSEVLSRI